MLLFKTLLFCNIALVYGQLFFGDSPTSSDNAGSSSSPVKFANEGGQSDNINIADILGLEKVSTRNNFGVSQRKGQSCTDPRGQEGTCQFIFDPQCGNVLRAIRTLGLTRQVRRFLLRAIRSPCGFERNDFSLCCVDPNAGGSSTTTTRATTTTVQTTTRPSTTTTTTRTTTKKPLIPSTDCGVQDSLRIVNGVDSDPGSWPWAAILGIPIGSSGIRVVCGGTLISNDYVLTAAHCFDGRNDATIVRLGDLDISTPSEVRHQDIPIGRVIKHPSFSSTSLKNDIALVRLSSPVIFRTGLRPACLPEKYRGFSLQRLRRQPTIIGWGSTGTDLPTSTSLKEAQVPLETVDNCDRKYRPVNNIDIGNTQICAGFGSTDTCNGDSGGPMLSAELDDGKWAVIGITSFGVKCADERFPGVYTRVDQYLDWIESNSN